MAVCRTDQIHPWTWGTEVHPGHTTEGLRQAPLQLEDDIAWGRQILTQRSTLTDADIQRMKLFDEARIEDTNFALRYGLVHDVVERDIPLGIMTWNVT